jgi:hypothetical protein
MDDFVQVAMKLSGGMRKEHWKIDIIMKKWWKHLRPRK